MFGAKNKLRKMFNLFNIFNKDLLINLALSAFLFLTTNLCADPIKALIIDYWIKDTTCNDCTMRFFLFELVFLLFSIALAAVLYSRRSTFLPIEIRKITPPNQVNPNKILVLAISRANWVWSAKELSQTNGTHLSLPDKLNDVLATMSTLQERNFFSWEQILRAVKAHEARLERIILVGSSGENGTAKNFAECRKMIEHYFPKLTDDSFDLQEANFDSLDELLNIYRQIIKEHASSEDEIMIDITSGTKVVSIAAAMVTLEHPKVEFQYVETNDAKRIRSFNVESKQHA